MKRKLLFLTLVLALLTAFTVIVNASTVEWTISNDMSEIIVDSKPYELYDVELDNSIFPLPDKLFVYYDMVSFYQLMRNYEENGIMILLSPDDSYTIYTDKNGRDILDDFFEGDYPTHKLYDSSFERVCSISQDFLSKLSLGNTVSLNVKNLESYNIYKILGYDKTETIAHITGAIYYLGAEYYYINYDALANNYFDSYGSFSYRQGEVSAYVLEPNQVSKLIDYTSDMSYLNTVYEEDESSSLQGFDRAFYVVIFIIFTSIFGFIIPLVPITICAVRLFTKKSKNPKRLILIVSILCAWILLSIGILLTLML